MAGCCGQEDTTVVVHCTGLAPPPHRSFLTEAESWGSVSPGSGSLARAQQHVFVLRTTTREGDRGGNLLVFCKSMQPPTSCVSKATTSSSIKKCIFRNLVKGSTKNALSVDKGWIWKMVNKFKGEQWYFGKDMWILFVGNISLIVAAPLGKIGRQHLNKGELFTPPRNRVNLQITAQF